MYAYVCMYCWPAVWLAGMNVCQCMHTYAWASGARINTSEYMWVRIPSTIVRIAYSPGGKIYR